MFGEYTVDLISEEPLTGFTVRKISVLDKKVCFLYLNHSIKTTSPFIVYEYNYDQILYKHLYVCTIHSGSDSEGTPSDSVPHHLLGTRWSVLQPEGCGGCDRRSGQSPEENWKQTYTSPLQV